MSYSIWGGVTLCMLWANVHTKDHSTIGDSGSNKRCEGKSRTSMLRVAPSVLLQNGTWWRCFSQGFHLQNGIQHCPWPFKIEPYNIYKMVFGLGTSLFRPTFQTEFLFCTGVHLWILIWMTILYQSCLMLGVGLADHFVDRSDVRQYHFVQSK